MNTRYCFSQKILAMLLALVLVLGMMPRFTLGASAVDVQEKAADPSTMDGWTRFFGDADEAASERIDTEFAGGVWTDKSVFTDASAFPGLSMTDEDHFLVAMSAIAASEKVSGSSASPMDTMLVLDLSNSMDNARAVPDMIRATNDTIDALLNMNPNNRVGVVLYSGNTSTNQDAQASSATVILPLDRYEGVEVTEGWGQNQETYVSYLTCSGNSDTTVSVTEDVTYADGTAINTGSKNTNGGTYIQNGLYKAWQQFDAAIQSTTDTVVNGAKRTPVIVLMSDGAPTIATTSFNAVGTSNVGDGSDTTNRITFLTQLSAAWVEGKVTAEYGTDAKFYTLGMGSGLGEEGTAVLYPQGSNAVLTEWWSDYVAATPGANVTVSYGNNWNTQSTTVYRDAAVSGKNYVDRYWYTEDPEDLIGAFEEIVGEIELQSTFSVTLVEGGDEDLSGYVTFEDELGEFMEVKEIEGIQLGDQLFTGTHFMESLEQMGSREDATEYGDEFIRTVKERLGIENTSDAQQLVAAAYAAGQLGTDRGDGVIRNYIGWYADADGNYLGFWDDSYGTENAPAGAVYVNKSYGYLGAEDDTLEASDMMHVVVMVHTNIESGHQSVIFKIPASLLPTVQYTVELSGENLQTVESVSRTGADPIRLVFEVGLRSDINAVNMVQKLEEAVAAGDHHVHKNADGTYTFYTNRWGDDEGGEINYDEPASHLVAESHFHPSYDNKRFYFTDDTVLYVADGNGGYEAYTEATAPSGEDFYFGRSYYAAGSSTVVTDYIELLPATVAEAAANGQQDNGTWVIPAGTPILNYASVRAQKTANTTETLAYSFYPTIMVDTSDTATANDYNVYTFLGNNGKLTVEPAQGLSITKAVTEAVTGAPTEFEFTVVLSQAEAGLTVTDADGNALEEGTDWTSDDNKTVTIYLADGQTAVISGLTAGTTYTVTETGEALGFYNVSATGTTGTVTDYAINEAVFTNSPIQYGELVITKEVVHPFAADPEALADVEFRFEVVLEGMAGETVKVGGVDTVVGTDDKLTGIVLTNDASVTISGIPEDTEYQVIELPTAGFGLDTQESSGLTGTVPGNSQAYADVINNYPVVVEEDLNINITVNKIVDGTYTGEEDFVFELERLNEDGQTYTLVQELKVANGSDVMSVVYDLALTLDDLGTYHYRLTEKAPTKPTPGMTYSAARGTFRIDVTDTNMDGDLEIAVVSVGNVSVSGSGNSFAVAMTFENTYQVNSTNVHVTVKKDLQNDTGVSMALSGYVFGFYLKNADGTVADEPSYIRTTGPAGLAELNIPVTDAAQDGTVYVIKEIVPENKLPGMTYDDTQYEVTIHVTDNESQLEASATLTLNGQTFDGGIALFENVYRLEAAQLTLSGSKALTGREPVGNEFSFKITETDATFANVLSGGYTDTQSAGKGTFTFDTITYTTAGTRYYLIEEIPGTAGGMSYDGAKYHVTVTVAPDGDKLATTTHVTKVGAGTVINASTDAAISGFDFANTYTVSGNATLDLNGSKTLTGGRSMAAGEFEFVLKEGDAQIAKVGNLPNGTFVFPTITYGVEDMGEHTYTVSEVKGSIGGVTYDETVYTFTVEVVDNGQGGLAVEGAGDIPALSFTNTYYAQPVTVTLSGDKTWTNSDTGAAIDVGAGDFTFELYESNETFSTQGALVASGSTDADGNFSISKTYYHGEDRIYYYILREQIGEDTTVTYDPAIYNVRVLISDIGSGQLMAYTTIQKVGVSGDVASSEVDFHNRYMPAPATLTIQGTKTIAGESSRIPVDGEFDFQLFQVEDDSFTVAAGAEPVQTVSNVGGVFTFDALEFENTDTYYYVVREFVPSGAVDNVYNGMTYDVVDTLVTVNVQDVNGQLQATAAYTKGGSTVASPLFTNTYDANGDITFSVGGTKGYNKDIEQTGQFLFTMYDENGYHIATVPAHTDGSFSFSGIHFHADAAGDYTFTVKENSPEGGKLNGITYDYLKEYTITVKVKDNGSGVLVLDGDPVIVESGTTTSVSSMIFTNNYQAESVDVTIRGFKSLTGRDLKAGEFTIQLIEDDEVIDETTNSVLGGFVFDTITYDEEGEHVYTVKEVNDGKGGVTYDETGYTVTVKVEDNDLGALVATVTYPEVPVEGRADTGLIIRNTYAVNTPTYFDLSGTKSYTTDVPGKELTMPTGSDAFTFELRDEQGSLVDTVTAGANGTFSFQDVELTTVGQHTFTLTEVKGSLGGVSYDTREYTVTVMTYDNGDGTMSAGAPVVTLNGQTTTAAFANTYSVTGPAVFDIEGIKAWLNITDSENETEMTMVGGEFTFELYEGSKKLGTATNDASGKFAFQDIELDTLGVHTLTVKEVLPEGGKLNGTTYDAKEYTVTVTVKDDNQGGMIAEVRREEADNLKLTNKYEVTGTGTTQIKGHKVLLGKDLKGGEFTFELYETDDTFALAADQKPMDTQVNGGTDKGSFVFDLAYTPEDMGTHYYVVKEAVPEGGVKDGVDYDERQFHVSVAVTDNGVGGLAVSEPAITLNEAPAELRFLNAYSVTGVAHVDIEGSKTLNGRKLTAGAFTFELYDDEGNLVEAVTNTAEGKFLFDDLPLTELGTYSYTVKEKAGTEKGMAYDARTFEVILKVSDNGVGGKTAEVLAIGLGEAEAELNFVNTYTPADMTVGVAVKKTVESKTEDTIGPDGFQFVLTDAEGKELAAVVSDKNGEAGFNLKYTASDIGKTYKYLVKETNTRKTGVVYDTTVHAITVAITANDNGDLVATVNGTAGTGVQVAFVNTYEKPVSPVTGDTFDLVLISTVMLLSVTGLVVLLIARKKKEETAE